MQISKHLHELINTLPDSPGVYLMLNKHKEIIYIGKAISLNKRVRQYFRSLNNTSPKVKAMVQNITDFEYLIADNEVEALILECNLIKEHKPKYNIVLKDDKHYPYIAIDLDENYPRIRIVRKMKKGNIRYFGPYLGARAMRMVIDTINRIFPIRTCNRDIDRSIKRGERPCLNMHLGRCVGPCSGNVSKEEYDILIKQVIRFLEGYGDEVAKELECKMLKLASEQKFERAAKCRDRLLALNKILNQHQRVISGARNDMDLIALANDGSQSLVQLFIIRGGKVLGSTSVNMSGANYDSDEEIMESFIKQYYHNIQLAPSKILVSCMPTNYEVLVKWIKKLNGKKTNIYIPMRGENRALMDMVKKNANQSLKKEKLQRQQEYFLLALSKADHGYM